MSEQDSDLSRRIIGVPTVADYDRLRNHKTEEITFDYEALNREVWPDPIPQRAKQWGVPPNAFEVSASFNRVFIWQIMTWDLRTDEDGNWFLKDSAFAVPDKVVRLAKEGAPRGILLSAGARAYERLLSNDIRLGDYVRFVKMTPYRMPIDMDSKWNVHHIIPMDEAAIVGSEDHAARLASGKVRREWVSNKDFRGFVYRGDGIPDDCYPSLPTSYEEM